MARFEFSQFVAAPPREVFELWVNLDRATEWIRGLSKITDVSGPADRAGTTYTWWFGRAASPTKVLEADPPRHIRTRFGNWYLRGVTEATFQPDGDGTRIVQRFETEGRISAIVGRIFATGSYPGSFREELATFARIAEREARERVKAPST